MSTVRGVRDRRFKFVQILNEMFEDPNLSLKAKGFIGFCLTKKENWDFHISHLCKVLKEGEGAIYSTIKECIENGYAYRYRTRDSKGQLSSVEFVISDSKTEILQIIKEKESDPNFKNCLPHRENPDVDYPHLKNPDVDYPHLKNPDVVFPGEIDVPIYSNTNNSNTREQQQQPLAVAAPLPAAGSLEKNKPNPQKIYPCLSKIDMPDYDKNEISRDYEEDTVIKAVAWALDQKQYSKGIAAAIKFACKRKIAKALPKEKPKEVVDCAPFNRSYWRQIVDKICSLGVKPHQLDIRESSDYLEINNGKLYLKDSSFLEQIESYFRKKNFINNDLFQMINGQKKHLFAQ